MLRHDPPPAGPRHRAGRLWVTVGLGLALLALSIAPLFLVHDPLMLDYPNHLARLWLLMDGDHPYSANQYYRVEWRGISTDIGVDLVAAALRGHMAAETFGRIVLILSVLLPPAGALALNWSLLRRVSAHQFIIPFFAWSPTALGGFLNFQLGLGSALIAAAVEAADRSGTPLWKASVRLMGGLLTYLLHPVGLVFYVLLQIGLAYGPGARSGGPGVTWRRAGGATAMVAVSLLPMAAVILATHTLPGNREATVATGTFTWNSAKGAVAALLSPGLGYGGGFGRILLVALAATCLIVARTAQVTAHRGLLGLAIVLGVSALFMPSGTPQGGWTDKRLPLMAVLVLLSAVQIQFRRATAERIASVAFGVLVVARTLWIGWNLQCGDALNRSVERAIEAAAPNSTILLVQHQPTIAEITRPPPGRFILPRETSYRHSGLGAIRLKGAFVPTLFAQAGVHPIGVRPAFSAIAWPEGGDLPSVNALSNPRLIPWDGSYLRYWRTRFDYVLVLNADFPDRNGPVNLPPDLELVRDTGFAQLFRIRRPGAATQVRSGRSDEVKLHAGRTGPRQ